MAWPQVTGRATSRLDVQPAEQVVLSFSDIMPNRSYSLGKGASGAFIRRASCLEADSTSSASTTNDLSDVGCSERKRRRRSQDPQADRTIGTALKMEPWVLEIRLRRISAAYGCERLLSDSQKSHFMSNAARARLISRVIFR